MRTPLSSCGSNSTSSVLRRTDTRSHELLLILTQQHIFHYNYIALAGGLTQPVGVSLQRSNSAASANDGTETFTGRSTNKKGTSLLNLMNSGSGAGGDLPDRPSSQSQGGDIRGGNGGRGGGNSNREFNNRDNNNRDSRDTRGDTRGGDNRGGAGAGGFSQYNNNNNNRGGGGQGLQGNPNQGNRSSEIDLREQVRQETRRRREAAVTMASCGIIVSLRDNFGFLQPLSSFSKGEIGAPEGEEASGSNSNINTLVKGLSEQLYFSDRECYANAKVGDEVFYVARDTPKGLQAANVRFIHSEQKLSTIARIPAGAAIDTNTTTGVTDIRILEARMQHGGNISNMNGVAMVDFEQIRTTGIVVKQCEPHRGNQPGLILITSFEECTLPLREASAVNGVSTDGELKPTTAMDIPDLPSLPQQLKNLGLISFTSDCCITRGAPIGR